MSLTVKDLENLQAQYPDYRLELVKGKIIVMSPSGYESDEVDLRDKIDEFLAQGTVVGILVNPEERTVEIRRLNQAPIVLQDGDVLTVSDLLPGWQVPVSAVWSPVFG